MSVHFYTAEELAGRDPLKRSARDFAEQSGPPITEDMVRQAEATLGVKLPDSLLDLLRETNGGFLRRPHLAIPELDDAVEVQYLAGIGWAQGWDAEWGSHSMSEEWQYPEGLLWLVGDGHWGVFLDYRTCGPEGEPSVVWYDCEEPIPTIRFIAPDFGAFLGLLRPHDEMSRAMRP